MNRSIPKNLFKTDNLMNVRIRHVIKRWVKMELNFEKHESVTVVYLHGRFDVSLTEKVEKDILRLVDDDHTSDFIFNLRGVEYLSSSGIGLFVSVMVKLKKRGKKLVLCELNSSVKKIMDLVEMSSLFNIFKSEAESHEFLKRQ